MNRADSIEADEQRKVRDSLLTNSSSVTQTNIATRLTKIEGKLSQHLNDYANQHHRLQQDARLRNHKQSLQTGVLARFETRVTDTERKIQANAAAITTYCARLDTHDQRFVLTRYEMRQVELATAYVARVLKTCIVALFILTVAFATFLIYFFFFYA